MKGQACVPFTGPFNPGSYCFYLGSIINTHVIDFKDSQHRYHNSSVLWDYLAPLKSDI